MSTTERTLGARLGFHPTATEGSVPELETTGSLPPWLHGDLVRVTPALTPDGDPVMRHWFDGRAVLHSFSIRDGRVGYTARRLGTRAASQADDGRFGATGFGTRPDRRRGERVGAVTAPTLNDNTNVNVVRHGDRYLAMTETPVPNEWDPVTLECRGLVRFRDHIRGFLATAHPLFDVATGELLNVITDAGPRGHGYQILGWAPGADRRRRIARIRTKDPRYLHSFAITERHLVLVLGPLFVDLFEVGLRDSSVLDAMHWDPARTTKVLVVDRADGRVVREVETDPLFLFHHVNAHDDGGSVVLDLVAWDDPSPIWALLPERLQNPAHHVAAVCGTLDRLTVPLHGGEIRRERLAAPRIEFPRINDACSSRRSRYAYASEYTSSSSDWYDAVVKLDNHDGTALRWCEPGCFAGESVFVPRPDGSTEDDGVLLTVVLDTTAARSFLLVLDARDLSELGRVLVPHHLPFDFHGGFFASRR